jgi:hypothetical protein
MNKKDSYISIILIIFTIGEELVEIGRFKVDGKFHGMGVPKLFKFCMRAPKQNGIEIKLPCHRL